MFDVTIIGGGVVGCAIARELSRYSLKVILLEKYAEVGFGTSKTNSGIIHSGQDSPRHTLKGQLVVKGNAMFDDLHQKLHFGFRRIGEVVVAESKEDLPKLWAMKEEGEAKGVPHLEMWDASRLQREEPNLSKHLAGALYAPTAGVINPYEFAFALMECAEQNGVTLQTDSPVVALCKEKDFFEITTSKNKIQSKFILNCAGVYADEIERLLGLNTFSILPRKGEEYLLDKRLKGVVKRLVFPLPTATSKGILIIPTYDGTMMVGPTAIETQDKDDVSTTPSGAKEVFDFVKRLCPSLELRAVIAEFAGLRAPSHTGDFIIGPTPLKGFINVAGIQSPGLTASPAIAEYVCQILAQEGLHLIEKDIFLDSIPPLTRFSSLSYEEKEKAILKNAKHARVVCRCELVTEGEIHEAIDHGAKTLDGIKFRTRAGMGRCQGGFCTSRCMDILSSRLNIPLEDVTKRGENSWLVLPMEKQEEVKS